MAALRVITPTQPSYVYRPTSDQVTIGRELDNLLILKDDPRVSRHHALLRLVGETCYLIDLGSGNGTFVNGERLPPKVEVILQDGDDVRLGSSQLIYRSEQQLKPEILPDGFRTVVAKVPSDLLATSPLASATDSQEVPASVYRHELEKKGRVLKLFYDLSNQLSGVFQLEEVYAQVLAMLLEVTPAGRAFIYQRVQADAGGPERFDQVAVRLRKDDQEKAADSNPLPISKSVFAKVANERVGVLLDDTQRTFTSESIVINQIRSVMAAPITSQQELLGIIYADRQDAAAVFTADDLDLLNAVAVQTGIAIRTVINHDHLQKQMQARSRLERFLPQPVVEEVLRSTGQLKLGGTRQQVTALFADIRGFTPLSEGSPPELVVTLLNRYFSLASEVIFKYGGTLDKYIGDGLLALFGAPYENVLQATQAVRAAIELQRRMRYLRAELQRDGLPEIQIGIGINTGQAIAGYVGSETRLEYTAIGDAINTASRLESIAKAGQIIISDYTRKELDTSVVAHPLGTTKLEGKLVNLRLWEIAWDTEEEARQTSVLKTDVRN
jgi:adenylate cyclase